MTPSPFTCGAWTPTRLLLTGIVVVAVIWWATPIAWTWYVLVGSIVTVVVALASARLRPQPVVGIAS